eukprot:XP_008184496.1 PREDICTED: kelch-like protein 3 [Acyrthosiphon pisum]
MTTERYNLSVGILNNRLYAVGSGNRVALKTVEYYDPKLDTWKPIANMSVCREGVSVGVLDGLLYAIGGYNGEYLKSVEVYRPSDGVWSSIADNIELCRFCPGVVSIDGLLYVIGGETEKSIVSTIEIYDPITNTWTMETLSFSRYGGQIYGGVVVNKPPNYN